MTSTLLAPPHLSPGYLTSPIRSYLKTPWRLCAIAGACLYCVIAVSMNSSDYRRMGACDRKILLLLYNFSDFELVWACYTAFGFNAIMERSI